jgi:hypothetical protein
MGKQLFVAVTLAAAISASMGFALGQVSNPQAADAADSNRAVVAQLKKINNSIRSVDSGLGSTADVRSVIGQLYAVNRSLGSSEFDLGSVRGLLRKMCGYLNPNSVTGLLC